MINNTFEFLLPSNISALHGLQHQIGGFDISMFEAIDDLLDASTQDFRFRTWLCNGVNDSDQAVQIGQELITLLNGAGKVFYGPFKPLKIVGLFHNGYNSNLPQVDSEMFLLPKLCSQASTPAGHLVAANQYILSRAIERSKSDIGIYILLQMFAMELNWVTLYKILETLETLMNQDSFASPISSTDRREFTNSANNFSIAGLNSRHGYKAVSKPNKTKAMSLLDGENLLKDAANKYLAFALK